MIQMKIKAAMVNNATLFSPYESLCLQRTFPKKYSKRITGQHHPLASGTGAGWSATASWMPLLPTGGGRKLGLCQKTNNTTGKNSMLLTLTKLQKKLSEASSLSLVGASC